MKAAGIVLSICVILASIPFFLMFHAFTFETRSPDMQLEFEPPEGYAYWERKEFRRDLRDLSIYGGPLLAIALSPIIGLIFLFRRPSRKFGLIFMIISLLLSLAPLWLMFDTTYTSSLFSWLLLLVLFCGCIYGAGAARVAIHSKTGTQQAGDRKPNPAAS